MKGYKPPFIAGVQQGENLLLNGPFLQKTPHRIVEGSGTATIAKRWPPDKRVKPVIPTFRAFAPLKFESVELIHNRYGI